MSKYYVERVTLSNCDRFNLRQTRFAEQLKQRGGLGHPHDLMAVGFTAESMRDLIAKYFAADTDASALPPEMLL